MIVLIGGRETQAHKTATSPFSYNEHIFPIFKARCGACHAEGGPAPMSLLTYQAAYPWATSIRDELTSGKMPPSYADPSGPAVKGEAPATAREIDMMITWAAGGTPQGDANKTPPPVAAQPPWPMGPPDLKLEMPSGHSLPSDVEEDTATISFPTSFSETKWIRAADLAPGAPSIVRDAIVSIENGPAVALWLPGTPPIPAPDDAAFKLPAGAKIVLRMHYKKPWHEASTPKTDRSAVGLYFAGQSAQDIQGLAAGAPETSGASGSRTVSTTLSAATQILAITPALDRPYGSVDVQAIAPSGARIPLLLLRSARPEWRRRYWLEKAVQVPAQSRIEMTVTPPALESDEARPGKTASLQLAIDYLRR